MDLNQYLFTRGYLITNNSHIKSNMITNYYKSFQLGKFYIHIHDETKFSYIESENINIFIIGHLYNPFTNQIDENNILNSLILKYNMNDQEFFNYMNDLSGTFIIGIVDNEQIKILNDASGIQTCFYGIYDKNLYACSHLMILEKL